MGFWPYVSYTCPLYRSVRCDGVTPTPNNAINPTCVEQGHNRAYDVTYFGDSLGEFIVRSNHPTASRYFDDQDRLAIDVRWCVEPLLCPFLNAVDNMLGALRSFARPTPQGIYGGQPQFYDHWSDYITVFSGQQALPLRVQNPSCVFPSYHPQPGREVFFRLVYSF